MAKVKSISYFQKINASEYPAGLPGRLTDLESENKYCPLKDAQYVDSFHVKSYYGDNNEYAAYSTVTVDSKGRFYSTCMVRGLVRNTDIINWLDSEPQPYIDYQNKVALVYQLMSLNNITISDDRNDPDRMTHIWLRSDLLTDYSVSEIEKMLSTIN